MSINEILELSEVTGETIRQISEDEKNELLAFLLMANKANKYCFDAQGEYTERLGQNLTRLTEQHRKFQDQITKDVKELKDRLKKVEAHFIEPTS
jgi:hypothetical protein